MARFRLSRLKPSDILDANRRVVRLASRQARRAETTQIAVTLERIAFVIPRVAARMPFRSDCLVQALAGQRWLAAAGIGCQIEIGVDNNSDDGFLAHAWLIHEDVIVTGGEVSRYRSLLRVCAK